MPDIPEPTSITINRAPVLTLWAAIVAERLGHDRDAALTLGRAVAGVNAQSKGRTLGLYEPPSAAEFGQRRRDAKRGETIEVELLGRTVRAKRMAEGLRAMERGEPSSPEAVERYLESKFGDSLAAARAAMVTLAEASPPAELAVNAFELYEAFRPEIPAGVRGWGAAGVLDLTRVRSLAKPGDTSRSNRTPDKPASARSPAARLRSERRA